FQIFANILNNKNNLILYFEIILFSILYSIAFHSWIIFVIMFLCLSYLLSKHWGIVYIIYAMSFLWGFIAFSIGYGMSLGWAVVLGGAFFVLGVQAHLTGLKKPISSPLVSVMETFINGLPERTNYQIYFTLDSNFQKEISEHKNIKTKHRL